MSELTCVNPTFQSVLNRSSKDKFILVLNLPEVLKRQSIRDETLDNIESIEMSVFGSVVPDVSIPPVAVPYGGQVLNVSSHTRPNYPPLSVNFIIDNTYTNYYVLYKWLAAINDPLKSIFLGEETPTDKGASFLKTGSLNDYQANFSILALNEYNQVVTEFKYFNAFITSLKGISYSYKDAQLMESSVEFQYGQFDISRRTNFQHAN